MIHAGKANLPRFRLWKADQRFFIFLCKLSAGRATYVCGAEWSSGAKRIKRKETE